MKRRKRPHGGHGVATVSGADPQPSARQPAGKAEETQGVCPAPQRPAGTALTATGEGAHHCSISTHAAGAGMGAGAEATAPHGAVTEPRARHTPQPSRRLFLERPHCGRLEPSTPGVGNSYKHTHAPGTRVPKYTTQKLSGTGRTRPLGSAGVGQSVVSKHSRVRLPSHNQRSLRHPHMLASEPTGEQPQVREGTRGSEERSWLQRRPQCDRPTRGSQLEGHVAHLLRAQESARRASASGVQKMESKPNPRREGNSRGGNRTS